MKLDLDIARREATAKLDQSKRGELGQFLTPMPVANLMASFFSSTTAPIHVLEAGAGVGSLLAAFIERFRQQATIDVTAYEISPILRSYLANTLLSYKDHLAEVNILGNDFILEGSRRVFQQEKHYSHAILNPPYKKINSNGLHRKTLEAAGQRHVNLYSAFVGLALAQLKADGELVAIIPRSFCNGPYYKPFRQYILAKSAITRIHLFTSRTSSFKEDEVLQENVIIVLKKGAPQGAVLLSQSETPDASAMAISEVPFETIVKPGDTEAFFYIPEIGAANGKKLSFNHSLASLGVDVSTGPVVDFRVKEFLRSEPDETTVPLLYPVHLNGKEIDWPKASKKPNAIVVANETKKALWPIGFYTLIRRFSSKEEKQRIFARVLNPAQFNSSVVAIENHLNVLHVNKQGLDEDLAYGLAAYLNSSYVDAYFREFNGHTQVNAGDLKSMPFPDYAILAEMGKQARHLTELLPEHVDPIVCHFL